MTDPKAFWASLTPEKALELLLAAPRVAGPWFMVQSCDCGCGEVGPTFIFHRRVLASGGSWMLASARPDWDEPGMWRATTWGPEFVHGCGVHETLEEAMGAADAPLCLEGWVLASGSPPGDVE